MNMVIELSLWHNDKKYQFTTTTIREGEIGPHGLTLRTGNTAQDSVDAMVKIMVPEGQ